MKKYHTFYIDPQSYGNLAMYDYNLLKDIHQDILYIHSNKYDYKSIAGWKEKPIFSYNNLHNPLIKILSYAVSYIRVFILVLIYRPKNIHIQWFKIPQADYLYFRVLKKISRIRLIHTAHNVLPHNTGDKYKNIYHKLYHLCDDIIVHAPISKTEIVNLFRISPDKIHVIPHGLLKINVNQELYKEQLPLLQKKYLLDDKIVFASLGEQSLYKGIDVLAKAWLGTPLLRDNDHLRLLIIGKQNNIDSSTLGACKNVIIDNRRISNEEFLFLLRNTDLFLLPYRKISQSGALLTALTEHVPVLVNNIGGLAEPLQIANIGWAMNNLSEDNLKNALLKILKDAKILTKIKNDNESWKKIEEHYSWKRIGQSTLKLYLLNK